MNQDLDSILRGIGRREQMGELGFAKHEAWAKSAEGVKEIRFIAEHFKEIDLETRTKVAEIAARTGMAGAVPLVLAGLDDSKAGTCVAAAVRYATYFGADPAFRSTVAFAMVRWLPRQCRSKPQDPARPKSPAENLVIDALPKLDPDLATLILATRKWLRPGTTFAFAVFKAFNSISLPLPLELIVQWLAHWEKPATSRPYDNSAFRAYKEGLFALVLHRPEEAIEKAERLMARYHGNADTISEIYLSAHGLANLYHRLCDYADEPATFEALPLPARVFFAVSYFASDSDNGGVGQALGNSVGDHFQLVLEGCRLIGDTVAVHFLSAVSDLFGPSGPPADHHERNRQLNAMWSDFESRVEAISVGKWSWAVTRVHLNRYAAKHAEILREIPPLRHA